jgi:hypothetical protein
MLLYNPDKVHDRLRGVGVALLIVVPAHRQAIFIYFSLNDYAAFLGILAIIYHAIPEGPYHLSPSVQLQRTFVLNPL